MSHNRFSQEALNRGYKLAIEVACKKFFRTSRCECDLDRKIIVVDFVLPKDRAALTQLSQKMDIIWDDYDTLVPVTIKIENLPNRIHRIVEKEILFAVEASHEKAVYDNWRNRVNTLVHGVVTYDTDDNYLEIDVQGTICIFPKRQWVKEEAKDLYRKGKAFMFHVSNVLFGEEHSSCDIILSRRSLAMPALILKTYAPEYQYVCIKRWPGRKSFVKSTVSKGAIQKAIMATSRELGEYIEIV